MLVEVGVCLVALLVVCVSHFVYRWSNPKCNGKLPPGAMGLPLVGDTFEFLASHSLYEISPFISKRIARNHFPCMHAGYTIPKGWIIMAALPVAHSSPDKYENPSVFNLWRWQGKELNAGSKTFMGFGIGARLCVGAEFTKVQMAVYLHHLVTKYSHWYRTWANPKVNGKLPPGSFGLPIIGQTLDFFATHSIYEMPPFIRKGYKRYGSLFRTGLLGEKMVVSTDPDVNYSLFQQENQSLVLWYGGTFSEVIGEDSMLAKHGNPHKYIKNLVLHFVGPENLKAKLLHEMDVATQRHLHSWATKGSIEVKDACRNMMFEFVAKKLMSYDETKDSRKLGAHMKKFMNGLIAFPLNIPGTAFHASVKGHKKIMKEFEDMYEERRASNVPGNDFLDYMVEDSKKENTLLNDPKVISKLLFAVLLAGYDSTSQALTLATKFINDDPRILKELTREHEAILKSRDNENSELTWEEYKSMTFTHMVINETVRMGNMVPSIFRKVVKEVEINGYTIPEGWILVAALPFVHLTADKYDDPFAFNPWRWQGQELHHGTKTFMGFGIGTRLCVGAEFAKVQMAIYLHHMATKYRWSVYKGGQIIRKPVNIFPNGLHIKIAQK
ncbi:hypothetical protein ACOSQ2_001082 [Xanthoceras sorbifolium]